MPVDTTAISIVSVSAGAIVALGGSVLTARFSATQGKRQHAHERQMTDLAELRSFLDRTFTSLQESVDSLLDLFSDIGAVSDAGPKLSSRTIDAHRSRVLDTRLAAGQLRATLTALQLRVGRTHPLALEFLSLLRHVIYTADAIPDSLPASETDRALFQQRLDDLIESQVAFIDLAATYIGLDLSGVGPRLDPMGPTTGV